MPPSTGPLKNGPELVIGMVAPIGVDLKTIESEIRGDLSRLGYQTVDINVSDLFGVDTSGLPNHERSVKLMDAGDDLRKRTERKDILAYMAMKAIRNSRQERGGDSVKPVPNTAYLIHSIKTPQEATLLRHVYRSSFVLVGVHAPRPKRLEHLQGVFERDTAGVDKAKAKERAESLIERDERDREEPFGQNVQDAFQLADVFVEEHDPNRQKSVWRILKLFFGDTSHTPTRHEHAMFHALASALRSGSLARQVGAVITDENGSILSLGTNDVPRSGGGLHWEDDPNDQRDTRSGFEPNDKYIFANAEELFTVLKKKKWIVPDRHQEDAAAFFAAIEGTRITNATEYARAVHAEMTALMEAARLGIPVKDATLYCTTFPCHNCAKHLIAAGIKTVYFIEPYAKSLAFDLHKDALGDGGVDFKPFVGVSPRRYMSVFQARKRKDASGNILPWDPQNAVFAHPEHALVYSSFETDAAAEIAPVVGNLSPPEPVEGATL